MEYLVCLLHLMAQSESQPLYAQEHALSFKGNEACMGMWQAGISLRFLFQCQGSLLGSQVSHNYITVLAGYGPVLNFSLDNLPWSGIDRGPIPRLDWRHLGKRPCP